jgi:hypothetical protein
LGSQNIENIMTKEELNAPTIRGFGRLPFLKL